MFVPELGSVVVCVLVLWQSMGVYVALSACVCVCVAQTPTPSERCVLVTRAGKDDQDIFIVYLPTL